jgi:hypothetical protein
MTPEQILSLPNPNEGDSSYTFERGLRDGYKQALEDVAELLRKEGADDSQAIDEEWLRAIGFKDFAREMIVIRNDQDDCLAFMLPSCRTPYVQGRGVYGCKTRGQLRCLCLGMGITLEEERT